MPKNMIDRAIFAHRGWVSKFRAVFSGKSTQDFNINEILDHTSCELGIWLESEPAKYAICGIVKAEIDRLHQVFHEEAYKIAVMVKQNDFSLGLASDITTCLDEFDNLSKQLVQLLMQAKKKSPA